MNSFLMRPCSSAPHRYGPLSLNNRCLVSHILSYSEVCKTLSRWLVELYFIPFGALTLSLDDWTQISYSYSEAT